MRRLNFKILAVFVVVVALLGAGAAALHRRQLRRTARALLASAAAAENQGKLALARDELARYLGLKPGDTDTLARHAALLDRLASTPQERSQAAAALEQVVRRAPGLRESRLRLAVVLMGLGRAGDARAHLALLLKAAPDDGDLEYLVGRCEEAGGEFQRAADWYERAAKHSPARLDAFERLAGLLRGRLNAPARADRAMDRMVAQNPRSARASLDRASYRRQYELAGADDDLNHALAVAPDSADVLLETARAAVAKGDFGGAGKALDRGKRAHPRDARFDEALADAALRSGRPDDAVAALRRGLDSQPDQRDLRWSLAHLLAQRGESVELEGEIDRLRRSGFAAPPLDYLAGCLAFNRGEWRAAAARLDGVQTALTAWPDLKARSLERLGRCHERLGAVDQRLAAFRRAASLSPDWTPARLGLAAALAAQGNVDQAIEEYRRALPKAPEAAPPLALLLTRREARKPAAEQDWGEVDALVDSLEKAGPDELGPAFLRADALAARGQLGGARQMLAAAAAKHPKDIEPRIALSRLAFREGGPDSALAVLDDARRDLGDRADLRVARIGLAGAKGDPSPALRRESEGLDKLPRAERIAVLRGLAGAFVAAGDVKEAARLCRLWADLDPKDLGPRLALFDLAFRAGDDAGMARLVAEIGRVEGDQGTLAKYSEARALARKAGRGDGAARDRARTMLTELAGRRPAWPLVPLALAELDDEAGDRDGAIRNYAKALDLGDSSPAAVERMARLLFAARRYDEAGQALAELPDGAPQSADLQRLAAGVALQTRQPGRAVDLARKAVDARPKDGRERLWLGQVLWAAGRRDEAERALTEAAALADAPPEVWAALVQYRAWLGLTGPAEDALRQAEARLPKDQAALALAHGHEALGHAAPARQWYEKAVAARPGDAAVEKEFVSFLIQAGQPADAEKRLRALLAKSDAAADEKAWARRSLAVVLTLSPDFARVREALDLMEKHGDAADDRRAWARVLVAQRTRRRRDEAVAVFARLDRDGLLDPDDRLLLAQLYDMNGDWPRAREHWERLLEAQPRNPVALFEYAAALRRHALADEVGPLADRLDQVEPQSLRAVSLRARVLNDQGKGAEAVAVVNAYAAGPRVQPALAPALLEELGRFPEAEALYRKSAAARPGDALALAEFLGRRDRCREALDLCERAWPDSPPRAVARACVAVLDAARADDEQVRRVAGWLEAESVKHPDETALVVALAAVRERQGRYPEAEALYRRAIDRGDGGGIPLNNLAWLVALKEGQGGEALRLADRAVALMGPEPELLDTRAVALLATGQTGRAIDDLNEAVAARPSPSILFHLAQAHLRAHDPKAAAAAFRRAKQSGLAADRLHPLEQTAFGRLAAEIGGR